jgi:hypothetical protein
MDESLIWQIYDGLGKQCQHFNSLETHYRALASTWLLAAFAGIGFVAKEVHGEVVWLFVLGISAAAALGILMLWLVDLMVYHRLLDATFAEQLAMEARYPWLPQASHRMLDTQSNRSVVPRVVWFYICVYAVLVAIVAIALWYISLSYLAAAALFVIAGVGVSVWMYRASTPRRG